MNTYATGTSFKGREFAKMMLLGILSAAVGLLASVGQTLAKETAKPSLAAKGGSAIRIGDYDVSFATPAGWKKVEEPGACRVSFYSPDSKSVLTVRIHPDSFGTRLMMSEKALLLMKRYPAAVKGIETQWSGANIEGRRIDFSRTPSKNAGVPSCYRMGAASLSGGLLEVLFSTSENAFSQQAYLCDAALQTMRCTLSRDTAETEVSLVAR